MSKSRESLASAANLVRAGYDQIAEHYMQARDQFKNIRYLDHFLDLLPPGATVLDLGCGCGVPVDRYRGSINSCGK